jgi:predicted CXXCH cytochrome family protein
MSILCSLLLKARPSGRTAGPLVLAFLACHVFFFQDCAGATSAKSAGAGSMPEVKKDCGLCHREHGAQKGMVLLNKPVQELCIECHPDRTTPNEHMVDIVPSMRVKKLPLLNGKMTCITCHDPHKNPYGKMLRAPQRDLCFICHPY